MSVYTIEQECSVFYLSCGDSDAIYTYKIIDKDGIEAASAVSYTSQGEASDRATTIAVALNVRNL